MNRKKKAALLFLSGGLSSFAFAPCHWAVLMAAGLAFLVKFLNQEQKHFSAFGLGFFYGAGLGAFGTHWITHALMIDGGRFAFLIPLVWLGFGLWFGLFWGFSCWGASYFPAGWRRLMALAGYFVILEWVRSWLFSGFPWNPIGNIRNFCLPVMQSVSVIGIYGLSGLTILLFGALALGWRDRFLHMMVIVFILMLGAGAFRLYTHENTFVWGTHLRLVQPNIPQTLKWDPESDRDNLAKLVHLSREKSRGRTHILWPETAVSFLLNTDHADRLQLMSAIPQGSVLLAGGMRALDADTLANSIFILDDLTDIRGYYDKFHLVPFGEYMPFRDWLPIDKIVPIMSDIYAGPGVRTLPVMNTLPAGMLVCYEVIFSAQVVDQAHRPAWLFNATNDGWYGISYGPYQHLAMAQTRSIEEGLPLVRAANTGISAVIDPMGRVIKSLDLGQSGVVDADLPTALPPTFYALFGVKVPLTMAVLFLLVAFKRKTSA